jgi:hypothetical protein
MRTLRFLLVAGAVLLAGQAVAQDWFTDDFNDGVIDPSHWRWGGAITESNGNLLVLRQSPADSIATISQYGGNYRIELDSRLDGIVWNDMFHGIAVMNRVGAGISFGYSMYGKLYLAVSDGTQTGYYYGPDGSNQPGQWLHWTLDKLGNQITVSVNGSQLFGPSGPVPEDCRVLMPGIYEDGDGDPHIGYTTSVIDNFSISPLTSGVGGSAPNASIVSWGRIKQGFER